MDSSNWCLPAQVPWGPYHSSETFGGFASCCPICQRIERYRRMMGSVAAATHASLRVDDVWDFAILQWFECDSTPPMSTVWTCYSVTALKQEPTTSMLMELMVTHQRERCWVWSVAGDLHVAANAVARQEFFSNIFAHISLHRSTPNDKTNFAGTLMLGIHWNSDTYPPHHFRHLHTEFLYLRSLNLLLGQA